jgi:hypothetical protein
MSTAWPPPAGRRTHTSVLQWPGLPTEYAWLPPTGAVTTTGAGQIRVAFTGHANMVRSSAGCTVRTDAPPGAVHVTGRTPITWG